MEALVIFGVLYLAVLCLTILVGALVRRKGFGRGTSDRAFVVSALLWPASFSAYIIFSIIKLTVFTPYELIKGK
jgi:hypothetical protein